MRSTAMSLDGSVPITVAAALVPSARVTVMVLAVVWLACIGRPLVGTV